MAAKRLKSVFTEDMDHCYFTGSPCVERHHIFGGNRKKLSEKYGFIIPLRPDLHPNGVFCTWNEDIRCLDIRIKQMAQKYYEAHYGSRGEFRREFGKSYL